jgi:hypothetical protein
MTSITRSDTVWVRLFLAVLLLAACSGGGRASGVDDRGIATVYVTNWSHSGDPGRFPTSKSSAMAVWWRWAVFPQRRPAQLTVLKWSSHLMAGVHT